ncbi:hypothetical protein HanRHA438_Chr06g0252781 [Helianthus annuus]|nr:hypothetical protein HanRHA438_Chr06g0252781 [Helianthus annuus]
MWQVLSPTTEAASAATPEFKSGTQDIFTVLLHRSSYNSRKYDSYE